MTDDWKIERLREKFPEAILEVREAVGELTVVVAREAIADVCRFLRDEEDHQYNFLLDVTGVDWLNRRRPRFEVVYHLLSTTHRRRLRLKTPVPEDDPTVPSVTDVWPAANWYERETYDMYGIEFTGHPDLRRLLMPEEWEGYPLRKDYPLGQEEVQFSFNWRDLEERKALARE